jgi:protein O-GlcNAc transferase
VIFRTLLAQLLIARGLRTERRGRPENAIRWYSAAIRLAPRFAPGHLNLGVCLETAGRDDEASRCYEAVLQLEPDNVPAHYNLGKRAYLDGDFGTAERHLRSALELRPRFPDAHLLLGAVREAQGDFAGALSETDKVLLQEPGYVGALLNRAGLLSQTGRRDEAIECYKRALEAEPRQPAVHWHIGNLLADSGRLAEAAERYREALAIDRDFKQAARSLSLVLDGQGRRQEAISALEEVVGRHPDFVDGHLALGTLLASDGRLGESAARIRQALLIEPHSASAHLALGHTLRARGKAGDALEHYRQALSAEPNSIDARWALVITHLQPVYDSSDSSVEARRAFDQGLSSLDAWIGGTRLAGASSAVGEPPPFYLAYQPENNRDLLSRYGALCARIMASHARARRALRPGSGRPLRALVVSAHLYNHSVWNALLKGWFQRHENRRFELESVYLGRERDNETRAAERFSSHFIAPAGPFDLIAGAIEQREPDVIIYPEIGMDAMTYKLASSRLAPVQVTTWGHPETSGLPTLDYFVSADGLEPSGAQAHYSEELALLPNLGCTYAARPFAKDAPDLGGQLDSGPPLLICPGTPFKYSPEHDSALVEIARRLGECRFAFFTFRVPEITRQLENRLRSRFLAEGLNPDRFLIFLPWQTPAQFRGLLSMASVYLDTIGFSGFNTAMEAIEASLPIVTIEGRFLRGRLASGILRRLGLDELVVATEADYASAVVRLCRDMGYRAAIQTRIRSARDILYDDPDPAAAMDDFVEGLAERARRT